MTSKGYLREEGRDERLRGGRRWREYKGSDGDEGVGGGRRTERRKRGDSEAGGEAGRGELVCSNIIPLHPLKLQCSASDRWWEGEQGEVNILYLTSSQAHY